MPTGEQIRRQTYQERLARQFVRRERMERESIAGQIRSLLRAHPTSQTSWADQAVWFERKGDLYGQLAEHYASSDPAEAAECRYQAQIATEQAARLRTVGKVA
jgi:hypothetical protein